ncbi:hypothetical protein CPB86DRAFT_814816 [Serendipita vermifera]|nr:hypothetical protein CPB86DRAFT_814816 [Serendipita vermifera]
MSSEFDALALEEKPLIEDISTDDTEGSDKDEGKTTDNSRSNVHKIDIGAWRIFYVSSKWAFVPGTETWRQLREMGTNMAYVGRFMKDLWKVAPGYLILWFFLEIWASMRSIISLWVRARMLQSLQDIVSQREVDVNALRMTFGLKFLQVILECTYRLTKARCRRSFESHVTKLAGSRMIDAVTQMDLRTLQRKDVQSKLKKMTYKIPGDTVWNAFTEIMEHLIGLVDVISQATFLLMFFISQENGYSLALVSVFPQVLNNILDKNIVFGAWFAHVANKSYLRMCALGGTAIDTEYSEEIISSGLGRYFRTEYYKASVALGETSVSSYHDILLGDTNVLKTCMQVCTHDLSLHGTLRHSP